MGTAGLTALAMIAFAANSLLCRLALGADRIDPASFTAIRLVSGAATLWAIVTLSGRGAPSGPGPGWLSAAMLFLYAAAFSFAYITLDAGTGALILFAAVQVTMISAGLRAGNRPHRLEWIGLFAALGGLLYLVAPGATPEPWAADPNEEIGGSHPLSAAPAPLGALLMAVAGVAWGIYSLRGRGARDPLGDTATSFARALPFALALSLVMLPGLDIGARGVLLAVLSGALASGLGYAIWYAALGGLTTTRAAIVQLSVPVLAAVGGVLFLAEPITLRLLVAMVLVLGGIALAIAGRDTGWRLRR